MLTGTIWYLPVESLASFEMGESPDAAGISVAGGASLFPAQTIVWQRSAFIIKKAAEKKAAVKARHAKPLHVGPGINIGHEGAISDNP